MTNEQMNDLADKIADLVFNAFTAAPDITPADLKGLVFVNAKAAIAEAVQHHSHD